MSILLDKIKRVGKQLYPQARAWVLDSLSYFNTLNDALADSKEEAYIKAKSLLYSILPDNSNFTAVDATNWEKALGLFNQTSLTLEQRKTAILRKMIHPGTQKARQHYLYLENQLQEAGFDVYVHENRFPSGGGYVVVDATPAIHGTAVLHGETILGNTGISGYEICANHILKAKDDTFILGDTEHIRATFFIGGQTYPDFITVQRERRDELRELILKLKPAHTAAILLINFELNFNLMSGDNFALMSGDNFVIS